MCLPDKYDMLKENIKILFYKNEQRYRYRRIHALLKRSDISEKIALRIMRENGPIFKLKRTKKYYSYKNEITPAAENII